MRTLPRDALVPSPVRGGPLRPRALASAALVLLVGLLGAARAGAELLANDDWISGQGVNFQAGFVMGETAAVRLTPTGPCPCQVDEVQFLFGGTTGTETVTVHVWDDTAGTNAPGPEIYQTTLDLTGTTDFMQSVDLRAAHVMVPGTFRVGLEFTHNGLPSVASDTSGINIGQNFIDEQTLGWQDAFIFGVSGDWVIRAVVDSGTPGSGTLLLNDGWQDGLVAYFQGGFHPGEIAAVRLVPVGPCPCRLDRIQFLFGGGAGTHDVTFRVWDDSALTTAPGAELYSTTLSVTGSDEFLQEVDVGSVGLMIDGPIRVGLEFSHLGFPGVARDDDGIHPDTNFIDDENQGWTEASELLVTGDWVIRAVLDADSSGGGTLLANDSWLPGQQVAFQGGFEPGEMAAVRLDPTGPCPCPVERVQFLFGGGAGTHDAILHIWDDSAGTDAPGAELYSTTLQLTGSDEFMQEVDISVAGVTVNDTFRVGLEFTHSGFPSVARDADGYTFGRNFIYDGAQWVEASTLMVFGDWIIRAVLPDPAGGGGELVNNDTWLPGQTVAFEAGFETGETASARFVPAGPCPCSLDRIRFLFGGDPATETVILRVWDDAALTPAPGALLYSAPIQLTGSDLFLQELDLTVANITVTGPFRVGLQFQHDGPPSVATDTDGIVPDRNFVDDSGMGWVESQTLGLSGDFVLRAVLDSVPGTLVAADSWTSSSAASAPTTLVAGETAATRLFPTEPCPCTLEDVRVLFAGGQTSQVVTLRIWNDSAGSDAPGALLFSRDVSLTPDDQVLRVIDLSEDGVVVPGPFRVGIELRHTGPPSVGVDDDGTTPGRSFAWTSALGWSESSAVGISGDWIIRATIGSGTQLPSLSGPGLLLLAGLLATLGARRMRTRRGD